MGCLSRLVRYHTLLRPYSSYQELKLAHQAHNLREAGRLNHIHQSVMTYMGLEAGRLNHIHQSVMTYMGWWIVGWQPITDRRSARLVVQPQQRSTYRAPANRG